MAEDKRLTAREAKIPPVAGTETNAENETDAPAPGMCFVASPIGSPDSDTRRRADWLIEAIVCPVAGDEFGLEVKRADRISSAGMIDSQVINALLDAPMVIADLSDLNANVFYEIGIRHMVGAKAGARKPIIHMIDPSTKIPFDVLPFRTIVYDISSPYTLERAKTDLRAFMSDALDEDHQVDNPVTRAAGRQQFEHHATPIETLLLQEIRELRGRLSLLEYLSDHTGVKTAPEISNIESRPTHTMHSSDEPMGIYSPSRERMHSIVTSVYKGRISRQQASDMLTRMSRQFAIKGDEKSAKAAEDLVETLPEEEDVEKNPNA